MQELFERVPRDTQLPARVHRLTALAAVLDGTVYDNAVHAFADEYNGAGEYIPLKDRRPSVRYPLCRNIVVESTSLVFGEARFPAIHSEDAAIRDTMKAIVKEANIAPTMLDASIKGAVGSRVLRLRVFSGRAHIDSLDSTYLTPTYDPTNPAELLKVTERRKVSGGDLAEAGYEAFEFDDRSMYWFLRVFDRVSETWFSPQPVAEAKEKPPTIDTERTTQHNLGFVPLVWVRNLPGGDDLDGASTFAPAILTNFEIDYHLSQAGRGLKYMSDPTLVLKNPGEASEGQLVRGAANAIQLDADGDAKLLQLDGNATTAVIDYVRTLREFALESVRGNRASPERLSAAQSGRALEVMAASLFALSDDLRQSWGENGLLPLLKMIVRASHRFPLKVNGKVIDPIPLDAELTLVWPKYVVADAEDDQANATRLDILTKSGLLSKETATRSLAPDFHIEDVGAEMARIAKDEAERLAAIPEAGRQLKVTE